LAEGIETAEQLATLRLLGCEFGQGYFFSPPIGPGSARNFIDRHWRFDAGVQLPPASFVDPAFTRRPGFADQRNYG
jgi:EAL domain-containing protein (putative c-di-GMP-specific phosphodiesterase class I)